MIYIDFHLKSGKTFTFSKPEWKTKAECGDFFGSLVGKDGKSWPEELREVFKYHKDFKQIHIYEDQA